MLLSMKRGILYGPVNSRRYGKSLGINLMPAFDKLCSFNCVYCHFGLTKRCTMDCGRFTNEMPPPENVIMAVEAAMKSPLEFGLVTFSGNGEPTLYPEFPALVRAIKKVRDALRPEVKIALLSNSTGISRPEVREVIPLMDLPVLKLDAGTPALLAAINRPAEGVSFDHLVHALMGLKNIRLQTVLLDGNPSNIRPASLRAWMGWVTQIKPVEIHLYSIDRPVPDQNIALVPKDRLVDIADEITRDTGVAARAFGM